MTTMNSTTDSADGAECAASEPASTTVQPITPSAIVSTWPAVRLRGGAIGTSEPALTGASEPALTGASEPAGEGKDFALARATASAYQVCPPKARKAPSPWGERPFDQ